MTPEYTLGKQRKFRIPIKSEYTKKTERIVKGYLVKKHEVPYLTMFVYVDGNHEWRTAEYHTGLRIGAFAACKTPEEAIDYTIARLEELTPEEQKESLSKTFADNPKINRGGIGYRDLLTTPA